jgi:hypothetical protein
MPVKEARKLQKTEFSHSMGPNTEISAKITLEEVRGQSETIHRIKCKDNPKK